MKVELIDLKQRYLDEKDELLNKSGLDFLCETANYNYCYNFDWMSRPIIQYPQDIVAFQEVVWKVKPDLIIEMGIARGGSLIYSASLLSMLDLCEHGEAKFFNGKTKALGTLPIYIRTAHVFFSLLATTGAARLAQMHSFSFGFYSKSQKT